MDLKIENLHKSYSGKPALNGINIEPEQFIKTDKWPETPLKNVFPAILFSTKQVSVNRSSILYNIIHPKQQRKDFEQ